MTNANCMTVSAVLLEAEWAQAQPSPRTIFMQNSLLGITMRAGGAERGLHRAPVARNVLAQLGGGEGHTAV
jgi:hypothetical protein